MEMVHQLLPFLRLDGYYIVSDLTGVPDILSRVKPTLKSMVPGREPEKPVKELKRWARVVVRLYVLALVPVLALMLGLMVFNLPRLVATAWDSLFVQWDKLSDAFGSGNVVGGVAGVVQIVSLTLPIAGIALTMSKTSKSLAFGAWRWSEDSPVRRFLLVVTTAAAASLSAFVLWPNGEYKPIQPGEKGTLQGAVEQFKSVPSGQPGLTEERKEELDGAPTEREQRGVKAPLEDDKPSGSGTSTTETSTGETSTEPTATEPTPTQTTETTSTTETTTTTTTTTTETTEDG
jgi:putative peptide zinc metalloprotease protein